jgi:soluble lytic murein transglycosylase-like protein
MHKHLLGLTIILLSSLQFAAAGSDSSTSILSVQENGKTVYVNNDLAAKASRPARRSSVLVYWSRTERRWVPVPPPSRWAMRAARSAAAEVATYVSAQPRTATPAADVDPNYRTLARGYVIRTADIDAAIEQAAVRHNVDPNLVRAIIKVESNFDPRAVSPKGAMGLMQLMPTTARKLNVTNPFDPQQNVDAGVRHLKVLLENFGGDVKLSLAAYNAGEGAVARNRGVPPFPETRNYVKRITDLYGTGGTRTLMPATTGSAPIRVFRNTQGTLEITNE